VGTFYDDIGAHARERRYRPRLYSQSELIFRYDISTVL
jgi:hypothetical protein